MDKLSPDKRSANMRCIKSKDMKPELFVRSVAHRLGYRFRLHVRDLPGKPDLVFRSRRKVVFVNGCFWHGHDCKEGSRIPKTNVDYWRTKIARNKARDADVRASLKDAGWGVLTIWECDCELDVYAKLQSFLSPRTSTVVASEDSRP